MGFMDGLKKIGGGVGDMWNASGGKVVSGVADGAEAVGGGVATAAKNVGGAAVEVAQGAGETGLNVVTLGGYGRDKDQMARQQEIIDRLNERDNDPGGKAAVAAAGSCGINAKEAIDKGKSAEEAVSEKVGEEPSKLAKYTVEQGDTLTKIAEDKGVDLDKLTELNPELAKDPNALSVGQELSLGDDQVAEKDLVAEAADKVGPAAPAADGPEVSV